MRSPKLPRLTRVALLCALTIAGASSAEAARRTRAGDACTFRSTGVTVGNPALMCIPITLRSNGRRVWKWIPVDPGTSYPSDAQIRRYGGAPGVPTTTGAPAASPSGSSSGFGGGSGSTGAACLEGKWTADFRALDAFVQRASGSPGPFFTSGSHTYILSGGVFTGTGRVVMTGDPTGVVTGSAIATSQANYTATDSQFSFTGTSTFLSIDLRVNGQPINVPISSTGAASSSFICTSSTLTITTTLPNGVTAPLILTRGSST